ncbi:F-box and WD repeat domain containing protein 10B-like [Mytilus edulis]|uniref:F-box and WD repeat domain containing protein 10B-like n=1 Tax=Mytilus edulis TaxID=6550 RepID=UPI0039EF505D
MLEVCQYNSGISAITEPMNDGVITINGNMKHASADVEVYEFNLGQAQQLRCVNRSKATVCGDCEACILNNKLSDIKEWFPKLGDHSKKRLMLGLLRRFHSIDLLHQLVTLLHPMMCKDYTYARSRTCPSLNTDSSTLSSDRALSTDKVEDNISCYWQWFEKTNYWTKSNFAFAILQMCDSHLLHTLASQARTLLITEEKAALNLEDDDHLESSSICETEYSYKTDDHPELDMLISLSPEYGSPTRDPITGKKIRQAIRPQILDPHDFHDETSLSSLDPALMVIPSSAKAHSGVSHFKDFIRYLPVHLAKYILRLLDEASLHAAKDVSTKWQVLVSEVKVELELNKKLMEEVMLMQGASAQGVNHEYAKDIDVLVPNLYPGTREVIKTNGEVTYHPDYKTMMTFETGYSGISVRNAIIEERNVFCGSYYVQIMLKLDDGHRVFHTDGGNLIVTGSKDRKLRFIEMENRAELDLKISGHAGSIKCVHLNEEENYVLSGSYDTSIRKWSTKDGKCQKIFRGHRDTVLCIEVVENLLCSGSKDGACKIWNMQTGKCISNLKHRSPVSACAMSEEMVITGCEDGLVKVWDLKSAELIKILKGHDDQITAIKFDRWHIITGSKDSYAHVYSTQGNHERILNALKHPQAVLCLAFMYLRVITGSKDGRLRIWNMVTGQCCRIMRGNSQSDPIRSIVAIGDRITLNTDKNLLVLSFDPPNWDYTLESDKVPSLVPYSSYSDAPMRHREYSYIRACRMQKAGATNTKILQRGHAKASSDYIYEGFPQTRFRAPQLPHSAKSLSKRSMHSAKMIQTQQYAESGYESGTTPIRMESRMASSVLSSKKSVHSAPLHPPFPKTRPKSEYSVVIATDKHDIDEDEEDEIEPHPSMIRRRVSWAFDKPLIPKSKDVSLSETKAILRSQIRMKAESIVPPDFIYLTVNAIQSSMQPSELSANTNKNIRDLSLRLKELKKRPSSSPSKIDPRTKVPVEEMGLDRLMPKTEEMDTKSVSEFSEAKSHKSKKSKEGVTLHGPDKEVYATQCDVIPTKVKVRTSLHQKTTKKTVPNGRVIRPVSASASRRHPPPEEEKGRPITAPSLRRPGTCFSVPSTISPAMPGVSPPKRHEGISSTAYETNIVPMCMYPPDMKEKLAQLLQEKRKALGHDILRTRSESSLGGRVGQFSDPLRSHVKFELRTYEQEKGFVDSIEKSNLEKRRKEEGELERKRKAAWLARAKSSTSIKERPKTVS